MAIQKTPADRLRAAGERVNAELARCASEYDQARAQTDAHHEAMAAGAESAQAKADALRPALEAVAFGSAAPRRDFERQARKYLRLTARAGKCRSARAMTARRP